MKLEQMYPSRYVCGRHLQTPILCKVVDVHQEDMHPRQGVTERKWVMTVERVDPAGKVQSIAGCTRAAAGYAVILRHTLALQIAEVLQGDDTDSWRGRMIVLESAQARAGGEEVTTINARAPKIKAA
jgi:hypothetical protein